MRVSEVAHAMSAVPDAVGDADAVVFDLDGTLYAQRPVRRAMARRLLAAHLTRPRDGLRTMRGLAAYRRAQEGLRTDGRQGDLARRQLERAAAATGLDPAVLAERVAHWMERAPLDLVAAHARPGLAATLAALRARGVKLGVLSDYHAAAKLEALGVETQFDVVRCAQDHDIGAFKPDPRGLLVTLRELGVDPARAVYVGDRSDVDGAAATAAGVRFVLIDSSPSRAVAA